MRILVVDDSRFIRQLIKQTLEFGQFGALELQYAGDAEEALVLLRSFTPDVLIVDLYLPGMSGQEFVAAFKKMGGAAQFGFISSIDEAELKRLAQAAGAAFYVSKPFSREKVLEALGKVMPR